MADRPLRPGSILFQLTRLHAGEEFKPLLHPADRINTELTLLHCIKDLLLEHEVMHIVLRSGSVLLLSINGVTGVDHALLLQPLGDQDFVVWIALIKLHRIGVAGVISIYPLFRALYVLSTSACAEFNPA